MSYEAEQQVVRALRSLPWYMFLVPALFTLLILLFEPSMLTDTHPEYGYWAMMWIVAKLGFFVWVLRQLLRYAVFQWMTKLTKTIGSYSQPHIVAPSNAYRVTPSRPQVTVISRRVIQRSERRCI